MYYWKQEIIIGQCSIMAVFESYYKSTLLRAIQIKILTFNFLSKHVTKIKDICLNFYNISLPLLP